MATPVGHLLAGGIVGAAVSSGGDLRRGLGAGALAAVAADLDFLPGAIVGHPAQFHHTVTHSAGFVLLAAGVVWLLASEARLRLAALAATAYASHLVLDYFTADDSLPRGIPVLWPLTDRAFLSTAAVFPRVVHTNGELLGAHNLSVIARELALLGPVLAVVVAWRWRARRESMTRSGF